MHLGVRYLAGVLKPGICQVLFNEQAWVHSNQPLARGHNDRQQIADKHESGFQHSALLQVTIQT